MNGIISREVLKGNIHCQSAWIRLSEIGISTDVARVAMIGGTGMCDIDMVTKLFKSGRRRVILWEEWGLIVPKKPDHPGCFVIGELLDGTLCVFACGRPHANQCEESGDRTLIRRFMGILFTLMGSCRLLWVTQAVGGLQEDMFKDSIALPTSCYGSDFTAARYGGNVSTDDHELTDKLYHDTKSDIYRLVCESADEACLTVSRRGEDVFYKPVVGNDFGGKATRHVCRVLGLHSVGMSGYMETYCAVTENATNGNGPKIVPVHVQFVSDNENAPSAAKVQAAAGKVAPRVLEMMARATPKLLEHLYKAG